MSGARTWRVLAAERARELCLGIPFVVLLALQQAVLYFVQRNALRALESNGLMVALHPAQHGLLAAVVLLAVFLAAYAAAGPAHQRESGALETVFYGPVSGLHYVLAELSAIAVAALLSLAQLAVALLVGQAAVGYDMPPGLLALASLALAALLAVSAVALWLALLFRQERAATVVVASLLLLSLAAFGGDFVLANLDPGASFFVVFLRAMLSGFDSALRFVFPLGLFLDDVVRVASFGSVPLLHAAWYPLYAAAFAAAAVATIRGKGVAAR
jgi:hypothetical protein